MNSQNIVANGERTPRSVSRWDIAEQDRSKSSPTPAEIRARAFEIHIERGGIHRCDLNDWLQAERALQEKFKDKEKEQERNEDGVGTDQFLFAFVLSLL
jgi:hypothetical protein